MSDYRFSWYMHLRGNFGGYIESASIINGSSGGSGGGKLNAQGG